MSKNDPERARRLAEALRANLKKRKAPKEGQPADGRHEEKDEQK